MQRPYVLEIASALQLGKPEQGNTRAQWANFRCPLSQWTHPKGQSKSFTFGITCSDKPSRYYCFSCHSKGTLVGLVYELGRRRGKDYVKLGQDVEHQELIGPRISFPAWDDEDLYEANSNDAAYSESIPNPKTEYAYPSAAGHPYLIGRGISAYAAVSLGLRYDGYQRRILFPVKDYRGRFRGFSGRRTERQSSYDADGAPLDFNGRAYIKVRDYLGLPKRDVFIGEHKLRNRRNYNGKRRGSYVTLVEGLFDYAVVHSLGYTTLGILGSNLTDRKAQTLIDAGRPVILFMDNDEGGGLAVQDCIKWLYGKVPLLGVKYPRGYDESDPASLPHDVIHRMIDKAKLIIEH